MPAFPSAEAFNIVVLYESSDLLGRAMATCSHLRYQLASEFTTALRLWRIDIAASAEHAVQADRDLAAADVIVIGVRGNQPCPPEFRRWREAAGSGGGVPWRAIIALVDTDDEAAGTGETWNNVLRGGATQIHPEIFVWEPPEEFGGVGLPLHEPAAEPLTVGSLTEF